MPTYQYACTDCDAQLEVRQSFTDDALSVCPTCEGRLRKIFNAVGVVFKGSGFYKTDSRKTPEGASGEKASGEKTSGEKQTAGTTSGTKSDGGTGSSGGSASGGSKTSSSAA